LAVFVRRPDAGRTVTLNIPRILTVFNDFVSPATELPDYISPSVL